MSNVLRDAYDGLWSALESAPDFLTLFPHGTPHQVRYNSSLPWAQEPDLVDPLPSDYPRVRLTLHSAEPNPEADSSGSMLRMIYQLEICTGQQDQGILMDCVWPAFCASLNWREYVQQAVTLDGLYPVVDVEPLAMEYEDPQRVVFSHVLRARERGTAQWIVAWRWAIMFGFQSTSIKPRGT